MSDAVTIERMKKIDYVWIPTTTPVTDTHPRLLNTDPLAISCVKRMGFSHSRRLNHDAPNACTCDCFSADQSVKRRSARGTGAPTGSTAMTGLIVGMPLRASIGTEALTIENHSSGLLNNTSARLARTLFHLFRS